MRVLVLTLRISLRDDCGESLLLLLLTVHHRIHAHFPQKGGGGRGPLSFPFYLFSL